MIDMLEIRIAQDQDEINEALMVREEVFVKGQGISFDRERDGLDDCAEHVILYYNDKPTGAARVRYLDGGMKLERVAILDEARGRGLGVKLMEFLVQYGKQKDVKEMNMYAQYYLLGFYSKFDFMQRGDVFYDADIKHVEMFLDLSVKR